MTHCNRKRRPAINETTLMYSTSIYLEDTEPDQQSALYL